MQWKKLVAIVALIQCNSDLFQNKYVAIWCDNKPVVDMLIKWRTTLHKPDLQHLIQRVARLCIDDDIKPW